MSLTVSSELRSGLQVIKLGGAVEDDVLGSALDAVRATSDGDAPIIIDLDELTICSRSPFEALIADARDAERENEVLLICRRRSARRLLRSLGIANELPVYESVDAVLATRIRRAKSDDGPARH